MRHYARSLFCSGRQSLLRLGSFFAPSSKLFSHLPTSCKHSSLVLWSRSVGGCIRDTVEVNRSLCSRAERVRCFGLVGVCTKYILSRSSTNRGTPLAKTKLHQEYPRRKKRIPPLSRKLVFFANRNTQKNMQLLYKIHTVFTAALRLRVILITLSQVQYSTVQYSTVQWWRVWEKRNAH